MSEIVAKITNLSHKYKDVIALEDINLELPKGGNYVVFNCTTCYNINYSIQIN